MSAVATRQGPVSETAYWVAKYRAMESARTDRLFNDPFAARLAGSLGIQLPKGVPPWPMIARTRLVDDLVAAAIDEGVDRVLNLAAGLDTRPYHLKLPPTLCWIEADFATVIEEKERILASEQPACDLVCERVDLADAAARKAFLDRALDEAENALVITEGFLLYLDDSAVQELGREPQERASVRLWIADLASPGTLRRLQKQTKSRLDESERMKFAPPNGVDFFEPLAWTPKEIRSLFKEAAWHKRLPFALRLLASLPDANPRKLGGRSWGGVVRFERGGF